MTIFVCVKTDFRIARWSHAFTEIQFPSKHTWLSSDTSTEFVWRGENVVCKREKFHIDVVLAPYIPKSKSGKMRRCGSESFRVRLKLTHMKLSSCIYEETWPRCSLGFPISYLMIVRSLTETKSMPNFMIGQSTMGERLPQAIS